MKVILCLLVMQEELIYNSRNMIVFGYELWESWWFFFLSLSLYLSIYLSISLSLSDTVPGVEGVIGCSNMDPPGTLYDGLREPNKGDAKVNPTPTPPNNTPPQ